MTLPRRIVGLIWIYYLYLARSVTGFQPPWTHRQQRHQRPPVSSSSPKSPGSHVSEQSLSRSSSLYVFNNNNNGGSDGEWMFGQRLNNNPTQIKINSKRDILVRLQIILTSTIRQFVSAWMTGYMIGSLWSVLRGPSSYTLLTGISRGMIWGMDFGILSAIFSGTDAMTNFLLDLSTFFKSKNGKNNDQGSSSSFTPQQPQESQPPTQMALLWSSVTRNILLAIYFGRHGGIVKMARSAILYGSLTYFFVSKKIQRDAVTMQQQWPSQDGTFSRQQQQQQQQQQAALQELLRRFASQQQQTGGSTTTSNRNNASSSSGFGTINQGTNKNSTSKTSSVPDNVMDVEFEKVDMNNDESGTLK